jgi:quinoprotein glucose dehydrogenase
MTGHISHETRIDLDLKICPGRNDQHSLISRQFFRCRPDQPYVRHDLRVWESASGRPRLRDTNGKVLLGDELMSDWRSRTVRGTARARYFDVHPDGQPPRWIRRRRTAGAIRAAHPAQVGRRDGRAAAGRAAASSNCSRNSPRRTTARLAISLGYQDHSAGGCRMGTDPATSVVSVTGAHDHENLFVVGSPTLPTGDFYERHADVRCRGAQGDDGDSEGVTIAVSLSGELELEFLLIAHGSLLVASPM